MENSGVIYELRKKLGISREKFRILLGLKTTIIIYWWERGMRQPSMKQAYKIIEMAQAVGMQLTIEMIKPRTPDV